MLGYSPILFPPSRYLLSYVLDIVTLLFSLQIFVSFIYILLAIIPISLLCTFIVTCILHWSYYTSYVAWLIYSKSDFWFLIYLLLYHDPSFALLITILYITLPAQWMSVCIYSIPFTVVYVLHLCNRSYQNISVSYALN